MRQLAADLSALGRWEEGVALKRRIGEGARRLGDAHSIAAAMNSLAEKYNSTGKHQEAIDMCNKAISDFQGDLGEGNFQMLEALRIIGTADWLLNKPRDAVKCFEKVLEGLRKTFGEQ